MGCSNRLLLNQSTHSRVAYSTASKDRHGPVGGLSHPDDAKNVVALNDA
jgi:hypothetical protein